MKNALPEEGCDAPVTVLRVEIVLPPSSPSNRHSYLPSSAPSDYPPSPGNTARFILDFMADMKAKEQNGAYLLISWKYLVRKKIMHKW